MTQSILPKLNTNHFESKTLNASYNHIPCFYFSHFFVQIFFSLLISYFLFIFLFFFVPFFFWPHPFPSHLFHGPLLSPQFIHSYSAAGTPGNALLKFRKLNIFFCQIRRLPPMWFIRKVCQNCLTPRSLAARTSTGQQHRLSEDSPIHAFVGRW